MNRRHFLPSLLALVSPSLWAADEPAPGAFVTPPMWLVGGRKQGTKARKVEPVLDRMGLQWMGAKMWGIEKDGSLIYLRPGKDETEPGTEYLWIRNHEEQGVVAGKKILRLELDTGEEDKMPPRGFFFLLEMETEADSGDVRYAGFFYLEGAKGEKLTSVLEKEKDPEGRLIVTVQPTGKGEARKYEFAFPKGVPELVPVTKPAKAKAAK